MVRLHGRGRGERLAGIFGIDTNPAGRPTIPAIDASWQLALPLLRLIGANSKFVVFPVDGRIRN
jgi:hypothetical protein